MQNKLIRTFLDYLPTIVTALLTIVTLILYVTVIEEHAMSAYVVVSLMPLVPLALTFVNRRWKFGIPRYLIILVCLHLILSADAGTAMGLYDRISWWDLMIHGFFGYLGCAFSYYLYFYFEKQAPKPLHYIVFVLLTLSLAGLWEIYEFVADLVFHSDMQCVADALAKGISPLTDTITDMMIAIVGAVLFYVALFVKKQLSKRKESGGTRY